MFDPDAAMDFRQNLLEESLSQVFAAYDEAKGEMADPVIFLVDCEDEIGGQFARAWQGEEAVEDALLDYGSTGDEDEPLVVTLARAFPFADCRHEVPKAFSYLADSFQAPTSEGFLTIVVAAGGAGTFTVPGSARPNQ